jgi:hypothetical protein
MTKKTDSLSFPIIILILLVFMLLGFWISSFFMMSFWDYLIALTFGLQTIDQIKGFFMILSLIFIGNFFKK